MNWSWFNLSHAGYEHQKWSIPDKECISLVKSTNQAFFSNDVLVVVMCILLLMKNITIESKTSTLCNLASVSYFDSNLNAPVHLKTQHPFLLPENSRMQKIMNRLCFKHPQILLMRSVLLVQLITASKPLLVVRYTASVCRMTQPSHGHVTRPPRGVCAFARSPCSSVSEARPRLLLSVHLTGKLLNSSKQMRQQLFPSKERREETSSLVN